MSIKTCYLFFRLHFYIKQVNGNLPSNMSMGNTLDMLKIDEQMYV